MSSFSVSITLFVAAAGAGLLSYPYAVYQQGILLNIISTLLCAVVTIFTDFVLVSTAALMRHGDAMKGEHTFDALAGAAFGPFARSAAFLSILLGTSGSLVGFLIVIGDLLEGPLRQVTGCTSSSGGCILTTRSLLIPLSAICVALPLSSFRQLATMRHSSALAALTVFVIAGVLLYYGGRASASDHLTPIIVTTQAPNDDLLSDLVFIRLRFISFFLAFPISVFTLGNHCQLVPAYLEVEVGHKASRTFATSIYLAVGTCVALYVLTGVGGYLAFRSTTLGDVLLNLSKNEPAAVTAKLLLALHVALAFPVLIFPLREAIANAAIRATHRLTQNSPHTTTTTTTMSCNLHFIALRFSQLAASPTIVAITLTTLATLFAVLCPQVSVVFGLVGATVATAQIHLFPALCLWTLADYREGKVSQIVLNGGGSHDAWSKAEQCSSLMMHEEKDESTTTNLIRRERNDDGFSNAALKEPALRYLSNSPKMLRIQSIALFSLFVIVALSGTSSYVIDTFDL